MENNPRPEKPRLVFVSHSGEDTWVARQIAREISSKGAKPFLDEADIDVGAEFEEDIRDTLDVADELLVLFTPWAFDRGRMFGRKSEPRGSEEYPLSSSCTGLR